MCPVSIHVGHEDARGKRDMKLQATTTQALAKAPVPVPMWVCGMAARPGGLKSGTAGSQPQTALAQRRAEESRAEERHGHTSTAHVSLEGMAYTYEKCCGVDGVVHWRSQGHEEIRLRLSILVIGLQ